MKSSRSFYNRFYMLYPVADFFFKSKKKKLAAVINALPAGDILEIGIGNGSILPLYTRHKITGIDLSPKMLSVAKARRTSVFAAFMEMNGEALEFSDGSFDYVVISHVLSVTGDPEKMVRESHRVLKPGGRLLIQNHFTPGNYLRYIDQLFDLVTPLFCFRSKFLLHSLAALQLFRNVKQIGSGPGKYFKIIILEK
ncbi:MAG: class I SAM-dependent methyltransferase [Sphingobacteriales bacterium]|nr:MAG: class I SAM-dependent methyltransferase [Sphingobacteriales bacterium]